MINEQIYGNKTKGSSPRLYFIVTFCFSWGFWLIAIILQNIMNNSFNFILYLIGGLGPSFACIFLLFKINSKDEQKKFYSRLSNIKLIKINWLLIVICLIFIASLVPILIEYIMNNENQYFQNALDFWVTPSFLLTAILLNFFAALIEEIGWRGYALEKLQLKNSAMISSLILGFFWASWHIPLYFIEGTYQFEEIGFNSLMFWILMIGIIIQTILMTWVHNNNNQSIIIAIIFHFLVNFIGEMFSLLDSAEFIRLIIFLIYALIVIIIYDSKKFINIKQQYKNGSNN